MITAHNGRLRSAGSYSLHAECAMFHAHISQVLTCSRPCLSNVVLRYDTIRHQVMKNEGIECLEGELLLVKLQNASCEGLHGKVCRVDLV